MAAIGACFLLILLVTLTMRDKKSRFHFDVLNPAATASATPVPAAAAAVAAASPGDVQALFVQGRAESQLIAPVEASPGPPPFVTNTDYANPPAYRNIQETALTQIYAQDPKQNKRALDKVARIGGFKTPEGMARAFGYQTVEEMVGRWDQTIANTPKFVPSRFGTNSPVGLPYED